MPRIYLGCKKNISPRCTDNNCRKRGDFMLQTISNYSGVIEIYSFLFVVPFIIGLIVRWIFHKLNKFYFVTLGLIVLTVLSYIVVSNINTHGSEGPMMRVIQLASLTVGSIIVEVINYFRKKKK